MTTCNITNTTMPQKLAKPILSIMSAILIGFSTFVNAQLPDFEGIVEHAGPAVVTITARHEQQTPEIRQIIPQGQKNLPEFFQRFFEQGPLTPMPEGRNGSGVGSGFFISDDGYLLTNSHVVAGADAFEVRLPDQRKFDAELIGSDERTDVALLKIDAQDLPYLEFADSDNLKVGQWVLAIGSPFGVFEYSATQGIISALARSLPDDGYVPFIQTDAAVNPGNSGGPLFNLDGKVIGINSQIYTRSGGFMGLSFAIPSNVVKKVSEQLRNKGFVSRGWLGVTIQQVDEAIAESFDLDEASGALVSEVNGQSPAAQAGFKVGDIITTFNGEKVNSSKDLPRIVGNTTIGADVEVEIIRNGKEMTLEVKVGELTNEKYRQLTGRAGQSDSADLFGISGQSLTPEQQKEQALDHGIEVLAVQPSSSAQAAGILVGDILLSFNRVDLNSPDDLHAAVKAAPRDRAISVLLVRDGQPRFITVTLN